MLPTFADDVRLVSEAADAPLEGRAAVGMHFRRHLEELREADPVNVVASHGTVAFAGADDYPCVVIYDGRGPSQLVCLEATPPAGDDPIGLRNPGEITAIHVIHDPDRLHASSTAEPPRFREPMDHPEMDA